MSLVSDSILIYPIEAELLVRNLAAKERYVSKFIPFLISKCFSFLRIATLPKTELILSFDILELKYPNCQMKVMSWVASGRSFGFLRVLVSSNNKQSCVV